MNNKFFYLFSVYGNINEIKNNSFLNIDIGFNNEPDYSNMEEIRGIIRIGGNRNLNFFLRITSKLLIVETSYAREKVKIIKLFNETFKNLYIEPFTPAINDEIDFICSDAEYTSFKVFLDNKIINSHDDESFDICKNLEEKNIELIEVSLKMHFNNNIIPFYYYGNAIQFPNSNEENIKAVIQKFEDRMILHV